MTYLKIIFFCFFHSDFGYLEVENTPPEQELIAEYPYRSRINDETKIYNFFFINVRAFYHLKSKLISFITTTTFHKNEPHLAEI